MGARGSAERSACVKLKAVEGRGPEAGGPFPSLPRVQRNLLGWANHLKRTVSVCSHLNYLAIGRCCMHLKARIQYLRVQRPFLAQHSLNAQRLNIHGEKQSG
jgi:hypothetical protein